MQCRFFWCDRHCHLRSLAHVQLNSRRGERIVRGVFSESVEAERRAGSSMETRGREDQVQPGMTARVGVTAGLVNVRRFCHDVGRPIFRLFVGSYHVIANSTERQQDHPGERALQSDHRGPSGTSSFVHRARSPTRRRYGKPAELSRQPAAMLIRSGNPQNDDTPVQAKRSIL